MRRRLRSVALVLGLGALLAGVGAAVCAAATPPFVPIDKTRIKVPKGVQPWLPTWTQDGTHIVFQNQVDGTSWITRNDGAGTKCISCDFTDRPAIFGGFTYAFPDGKRLFVSHELGGLGGIDAGPSADAWVLECAPSIVDCTSHRYLPVDMSADKGAALIIQRRTWHLAPDGIHLGWMDLRSDGTAMIVARLERQAAKYVASDPQVVNPTGPAGPSDSSADRWENASQLYELKSFADGGGAVLAVGEPRNNTDVLKIDLGSGRTTRLTANPDWDEDGALSPDARSEVVYSWRTRDRLDAAAWVPQIRGFAGPIFGAALAPFYVSTWPGFQCDLSPWLLPASGDAGGTLVGQPLDVYGGNRTPGNNLSGQQFWNPDSDAVLLQERLRTPPPAGANEQIAQKGLTPRRIAIARLDRAPRQPRAVVSSAVGSWAPAAASFAGTLSSNRTASVRGNAGGSATITYTGSLISGSIAVTFDRFTDDGKTFVDGTMSAGNPSATTMPWKLAADVTVSGEHTGSLKVDLSVDNNAKPLPAKSGTFTAVYDGRAAPPLPEVGPCYGKLPTRSKLRLALERIRSGVRATVTANVYGDVRPVRNATVRAGGISARTNKRGRARLALSGTGKRRVSATAGDTFVRVRKTVSLG